MGLAILGAVAAVATPGVAAAEPSPAPSPVPSPAVPSPAPETPVVDGTQHNVTYRARIDGLARGAEIYYRMSDAQANSADPAMLPGRTFEATGVLTDPKQAGMRISIQWPYSANLHCEILVDDQIVAQASQFISPRLTPVRNDPDYGVMNCGAPLDNLPGGPPVVSNGAPNGVS